MLRSVSPWTTILWLVPYLCGIMRATVWPADTDARWCVGALLFIGATFMICELLMRWYRYQVIREVRHSQEVASSGKSAEETIQGG